MFKYIIMQNMKVYGYTLLHRLGKGGMAEVWYAENDIEKPSAVKILNADLSLNEAIVERFRNEAKVTVKLNHPNIRQVYDFSAIDGRPCMVMEYLEGADLSARMKRGERFSDEQLQKWWNQLASALNYTHQQGVVHRDIKPSNIFVTDKGDVKLLDFGIAKVRDSITSTVTGAMMGTLMYMSPEQVRDSKHIDHKTDLYSLAVTFVHLLTGNAPYDRDSTDDFEIRNHIVNIPLEMDNVPRAWQSFLRPFLAKKPEERPALTEFTVGDGHGGFVPPVTPPASISEETVVGGSAATRVMDEETVAETPSTQLQPQPRSRKRKAWPWVLVALAVALVAILAMRGCGGKKSADENGGQPAAPTAPAKPVPAGYVDLGLSVYWKNSNENNSADDHGLYTYDDAKKFGSRLPTKAQLEELKDKCTWTWEGGSRANVSGYRVTGPNGNSIFLPAAGYRYCDGGVDGVGTLGYYWSSTPTGTEFAWGLYFDSGGHVMYLNGRCRGFSVRLVQGK